MKQIPSPSLTLAPTYDNFPLKPKPNEITFQIKCKTRNFCRNWKRQHIKQCLYCVHNFYHQIPPDGITQDNYDTWVPGIKVMP